jgi:predicted enzyme related to lactoylglutathione lyase
MPTKYAHTNLIARDWKRLAAFYQQVFGCLPIPPERDLSGEWLDKALGLSGARIRGIHLRLPGYGEDGPTLELFEYDSMPEHPPVHPNTPGFSHISFAVEDVPATAQAILEHGGSAVGELTVREVPGVGLLTFQYLADPEGNTIEVQHWSKKPGPEH